MQILPAKELLPFIRHYLFLNHKGDAFHRLRLFSDGHMGMVLSLKGGIFNTVPNASKLDSLPSSFLYGQISAFRDICFEDEVDLVVVVFQPAGISRLAGLPASELRSNVIRMNEMFGKAGDELCEQLAAKQVIQSKISLLNQFFRSQIIRRSISDDYFMSATIAFIKRSHGCISSPQLIKFTGYTERQIERKFQEVIGLSPKKFCSIVRLHHFLKELNSKEHGRHLTKLAYEAGYADQSHLIREFKRTTGMTPTAYQGRTVKLASNFIGLNNEPSLE